MVRADRPPSSTNLSIRTSAPSHWRQSCSVVGSVCPRSPENPMTPKLTEDMREALSRKTGGPIEVEDDRTQKVYVLVEREAFGMLIDDTLRQSLQIGLD